VNFTIQGDIQVQHEFSPEARLCKWKIKYKHGEEYSNNIYTWKEMPRIRQNIWAYILKKGPKRKTHFVCITGKTMQYFLVLCRT
jgi:hypothetical protein